MSRLSFAVLAALLSCSMSAHAAQICAWLVETEQPDHVRALDLWFQADTAITFIYNIDGRGIVSISGESNSPITAPYTLLRDQPRKAWSYGTTFYAPGRIDISVEVHKAPTDYYSNALMPTLAKFAFNREVPASEVDPPDTLAKKQCMEIVSGGLPF